MTLYGKLKLHGQLENAAGLLCEHRLITEAERRQIYRKLKEQRDSLPDLCPRCFGQGVVPPGLQCLRCNGTGEKQACTACTGSGYYDSDDNPKCGACNGTGIESADR